MNSIDLGLEGELCVVAIMRIGEEDVHCFLLNPSLDDGKLLSPIMRNLCGNCEILQGGLIHVPFHKDPLLGKEIFEVVDNKGVPQSPIVF